MTTWKQPWTPDEWTTGKGLWIVGTLIDTNFFVVSTPTQVLRFISCRVSVDCIFERLVNQFGNEVYPDFRNLANEKTLQRVPIDQVDLKYPAGLLSNEAKNATHPIVPNVLELWADVDLLKKFKKNDPVYLSTTGGFFIKQIQINNNGEGRFEGEDAQLMSQISHLMSNVKKTEAVEENEGVASEDWDDY